MRINRYVAQATGMSRRSADAAIADGRVRIDKAVAEPGSDVQTADRVYLDNQLLKPVVQHTTIMLNKPVGYVCSRVGQGSRTIYDLLPAEYQSLQSVGRLDKDSSGLLLLTNDGQLANKLAHPSYSKQKVYIIRLNKNLVAADKQKIEQGISVQDYISNLRLEPLGDDQWQVTMTQGRNRQIRRTFAALDYSVAKLHRIQFGDYALGDLNNGNYNEISADTAR